MQHVQRANLIFGKLVGTFEVVGLDLLLRLVCLHVFGLHVARR